MIADQGSPHRWGGERRRSSRDGFRLGCDLEHYSAASSGLAVQVSARARGPIYVSGAVNGEGSVGEAPVLVQTESIQAGECPTASDRWRQFVNRAASLP